MFHEKQSKSPSVKIVATAVPSSSLLLGANRKAHSHAAHGHPRTTASSKSGVQGSLGYRDTQGPPEFRKTSYCKVRGVWVMTMTMDTIFLRLKT